MIVTLANLKEATPQQVFDQVVTHLRTQGAKAATASGACRYRINSLKCAAGCLIADDEYKPEMDQPGSNAWSGLVSRELVPDAHANLIQSLQTVHDMSSTYDWEGELQVRAKQYGLQYTPQRSTI